MSCLADTADVVRVKFNLAEQQRQAAAAFQSASGLVYSRTRASEMADELGADEVVLPGPLLCIDRSICSQETHISDSVTCATINVTAGA